MFNFEGLLPELLKLILSYLPVKDRIKSAPTSKFFNNAVNDDIFWKNLLTDIAGNYYQKSNDILRSNKTHKEICLDTLKHLPTCAKTFIELITWSAKKEKQDFSNDSWNYFEHIVKGIREIPNMLNVYSIVKYLIKENHDFRKAGVTCHRDFVYIEHFLAVLNEPESLKLIVANRGDINIRGLDCFLPIHIAIMGGKNYEIIKTCIELGANLLSDENFDGHSPLECAAFRYHHAWLELLYSEKLLTIDNEKPETERLITTLFQQINDDLSEIKNVVDPETFCLQIFYMVNCGLLSAFHNNVSEAELKVKNNLPQQYNFLKTIDFFLKKGWEFPKWFNELINLAETARPSKCSRLTY